MRTPTRMRIGFKLRARLGEDDARDRRRAAFRRRLHLLRQTSSTPRGGPSAPCRSQPRHGRRLRRASPAAPRAALGLAGAMARQGIARGIQPQSEAKTQSPSRPACPSSTNFDINQLEYESPISRRPPPHPFLQRPAQQAGARQSNHLHSIPSGRESGSQGSSSPARPPRPRRNPFLHARRRVRTGST